MSERILAERPLGLWREMAPALALLALGLTGLAAAYLTPGGSGGQYAVVAPPWYGPGRTFDLVAAAGGRIAYAGGPGNLVVAWSDEPGFAGRLYGAGAWLVVDPMRLRGCRGEGRA
ncbi:hypothetical protein L6Q21_14085 [Sandaracinobacter sp. RS1-74]|uniref:hypothetical protein n=1 Tax=Sandaracinobacteroides sayramensis TaxID=2913411 RepID=UPI001EDC3E7B|nr:hypothetical protein [Sandaracinobacteroides sayramensis]MCG2842114.1 hypothetical protein [Sandaracinobacteroides sayramensis]